MRLWTVAAVCLVVSFAQATSAIARDREPIRLAPSGPWAIDYANESCRLARHFGEGESRVTFMLEGFQPGPRLFLTIVGEPVQLHRSSYEIPLRFGSSESEQTLTVIPTLSDDPPRILSVFPIKMFNDRSELELDSEQGHTAVVREWDAVAFGNAIDWISFTPPSRDTVILETGPMAKPLAAMRRCTQDLLRLWGTDPDSYRTESRHVSLSTTAKNLRFDYPVEMQRRGEGSITHIRLGVDELGKPTGCTVQKFVGYKNLSEAICKTFMNRARFEPALDASGEAIPSFFATHVGLWVPE